MTLEPWRRIEALYHEALAREAGERAAFLASACGEDDAMRHEVESLLAQDGSAAGILDARAIDLVAHAVTPARTTMVGQRLGVYQITVAIGAGGMGEVYRARDTRLGRDVAIKILPAAFTNDPDRLARFEREARVLASLNHPNIATIHGLEDGPADAGPHARAIVMELVEGETLDRYVASAGRRKGTAIADALGLARQIGDALDAAHERGIVHRDLKPANILVTTEGTVKVLDFGLAKAGGGAWASGASEELTIAATREGLIVGTAAYMSPEQARGQAVDKRTDIWAFGCVLYEMLAGRPAFAGATVSDTIAAVLERDPDWSLLPPATPSQVGRLLQRCLEKDLKRRLRDIGDARSELGDALEQQQSDKTSHAGQALQLGHHATGERSRARRAGLALAAVLTTLLVVAAGAGLSRLLTAPATPALDVTTRTTIALPQRLRLESSAPLALSPDGALLAFVAVNEDGTRDLHVRPLASTEAKLLPGTTNAMHPFFSPDGRSIGFFADGALQRIDVNGGAPLRVCPLPGVDHGGSWGAADTIVVAVRGQGLFTVNAAGGTLEKISDIRARWPSFLPDGRSILYASVAESGRTIGFSVVGLDGGTRRDVARLSDEDGQGAPVLGATAELAQAAVFSQGYLVYGQDPGFVRALPIDPESLARTGAAITLGESVERGANAGGIAFAAARNGLLVFAETGNAHQLVWVSRQGVVTPLDVERSAYRGPLLSPAGATIVVSANDETRTPNLWLIDAERGTKTRVASDALSPVWAPDGTRFAYNTRGGITITSTSGTSEVLLTPEQARSVLVGTNPYPSGWSPDGRHVLFQADNQDVWKVAVGGHTLEPVLVGARREWDATVSPDGRAIVYISDEAGRPEVYVARWPNLAQKTAVSTKGGTEPRWSRDSRELFFWQQQTLMVAQVGASLEVTVPRALFSGAFFGAARVSSFDVTPDGRFLMVKSDERAELRQLTVVQNWMPAR